MSIQLQNFFYHSKYIMLETNRQNCLKAMNRHCKDVEQEMEQKNRLEYCMEAKNHQNEQDVPVEQTITRSKLSVKSHSDV